MNTRKRKVLFGFVVCMLTLVMTLLPIYASAYSTYTYSIDGTQLSSPNAYEPQRVYDSVSTGITALSGKRLYEPKDLVVDPDGNIYICDGGTEFVNSGSAGSTEMIEIKHDRIVVLDRYFNYLYEISEFTNSMGASDVLNSPGGLCVTETKIYVADTKNARIVVFNRENGGRTQPSFHSIIGAPEAEVFPAGSSYTPVAVASNDSHVYVVSSSTYMGIISMDLKGEFQGFVGAQKVAANLLDIFWRTFQTAEQRAQSATYVSTEYNNIAIDESGFIYATTSNINEQRQQQAIESRSTSGNYAPVKKLNTAGEDVMNRTGFYPPSGEVKVAKVSYDGSPTGPSKIIDVAMGPERTWSIIDRQRQRIFTYDKNGNLLFAFGDKGKQLGNLESIKAIAYQDDNMLILDIYSKNPTIAMYTRTDYGDLLIKALRNDNNREYEKAVDDYEEILQRNINFDAAYIGIAKSLYRSGDYNGAMEQYSYAYNTAGYSQAFKMFRKDWVSKYIIVIPIVVVAVVFALSWFFKFAARVNAKTAVTKGKRTFGQELLFAFHLMVHPFDGFWDLKHEKRGSVRGAIFYTGLAVLVFTYQSIGRSYMYNPRGIYSSIGAQLLGVCVPLLLWVVANWCLTTLFDGEGSAKDIFIATGYSLAPLPFLIVPATLLTHILSSAESGIITLLTTFAFIWVGLLIFFGEMITHDYSIVKNAAMSICTIFGMGVIMFIFILFASLVSDMIGLVTNIVTEITYRL